MNIECGLDSVPLTDSSKNLYNLEVADTVLNYIEFAPLVSPNNCAVKHQIVAEDGTSYPKGIVVDGPTLTSGNMYRVVIADMFLEADYTFKIKSLNDGGSIFLSEVKTIKVACVPKSIEGTVSESVAKSIQLYVNYT